MNILQHYAHSSQLAVYGHDRRVRNKMKFSFLLTRLVYSQNVKLTDKGPTFGKTRKLSYHIMNHRNIFSSPITTCRKHVLLAVDSQSCSNFELDPCNADEQVIENTNGHPQSIRKSIFEFSKTFDGQLHPGDYRTELLCLALPAIIGQAIDPLAQLAETAYIGRLGSVELASAGISVTIFNIITKLFNIPLLSITTSFVAEDISKTTGQQLPSESDSLDEKFDDKMVPNTLERRQLPSVSTALLLALGIGAVEAFALFLGAGQFLKLMGVTSASSMHGPAQQFLALRALGAPAVVVSLAIQGIFRGFKDTQTPLFCVGLGNLSAICLLPILVYTFKFGLVGAAFATVTSQYITTALLVWSLNKKAILLPPKIRDLQFGGYIKSGGLLLGRTVSVLITMTLGTSMAARQGPLAMAAHQICLQVWLAVSLLSDALALSAQALIASSFAKYDYNRVKDITFFVLKTGVFIGLMLAIILGASFGSLGALFTKDVEVLQIIKAGVLFVSCSQPINALAFIFDGLHYGVSDFSYAAYSMMTVSALSSVFLLYAPSIFGLHGVWAGLTLFMALRMAAGFIRLQWKTGPWWFLWQDQQTPEVVVFILNLSIKASIFCPAQ